jgi:hypothetical protein
MDAHELKAKLNQAGITDFDTSRLDSDTEVVDASEPTDIEGLYKLIIITLKNKKTDEVYKKLVWGQPLKVVTIPIILNNAGINYMLLVSQSRFSYSGKVSIEVNKGFITEKTDVDDALLWHHLVNRKIPYLQDCAEIIKVVPLGNYTQHPDLTSFKMPIQLIFAKTKENYDIDELKALLKVKHDYINEPKSGPPLHSTQPVLRTLDEVNMRLDEIVENPDATNEEFYLNDSFSLAAITLMFDYIKFVGAPF